MIYLLKQEVFWQENTCSKKGCGVSSVVAGNLGRKSNGAPLVVKHWRL